MTKKISTKGDLVSYFEKLNLSDFKAGGKKFFTPSDVKTNPAGVIEKICELYKKVKPFLSAILIIPFIPKKIKDAIKTFMDVMDKLCPDRK